MNKSENLEDCITQELQAFHSNIFETHGDIREKITIYSQTWKVWKTF